jgi:hypothetical protein
MRGLLTCNLVALAQFIISPLATYLLISSTEVVLSGKPEGLLGDGKKASDKNTANLAFWNRFICDSSCSCLRM